MDSLATFEPSWGPVAEWNGAYEKVDDYLRAYGVDSHLHRARLTTSILQRIRARWDGLPPPAPIATLAIEETNRMLNEWFSRLLDEPVRLQDRFTDTDGRLALLLSDGPSRWPYSFLELDLIPADMKLALKTNRVKAGPDLQISNMVPRPIDRGRFSELAEDTLEALDRWPIIKSLIAGLLITALLTYLFWMTRFSV
ncbi:MAG: hypothetical protein U1E27_14320 [Kiritimatiellia bacterium]|nr:hypothetical protein [Kiritimatiellia bacterium]